MGLALPSAVPKLIHPEAVRSFKQLESVGPTPFANTTGTRIETGRCVKQRLIAPGNLFHESDRRCCVFAEARSGWRDLRVGVGVSTIQQQFRVRRRLRETRNTRMGGGTRRPQAEQPVPTGHHLPGGPR